MDRIEAHANSVAGDHPDIAEAAQRLKSVRGPDEAHTRVFRLEAIADLVELIDEVTEGEKADPLEGKKVAELRSIATQKGVENPQDLKKAELVEAIREAEAKDEDEEG